MSSVNGNETSKSIRLCHIVKWADYDGYGFNLHAEKNKPGQFIGKVDEGSPAEAAGLREGDKIIEVNGVNITSEDHKAVVKQIKQKPDETALLVVDKETAEQYLKNNVTISSSLPEVITLKTPPRPAANGTVTTEKEPMNGDVNGNENEITNEKADTKIEENIIANQNAANLNGTTNGTAEHTKAASSASDSPKSQKSMTSSEEGKAKLNLSMSAEEFRNKLALRKKYDPKKDNIDVLKKYEIIDQL